MHAKICVYACVVTSQSNVHVRKRMGMKGSSLYTCVSCSFLFV
jgi:hypothetical protein